MKQKIAYLIVGAWNTVFGFLSFMCLYLFFFKHIHYLIILIVSNILSITNAYLCYKYLVFKTKGNYLREYIRFYFIYGFAFCINILLLPVFVEIMHFTPVYAQGILVVFTVIISYTGHKNISFKEFTNE